MISIKSYLHVSASEVTHSPEFLWRLECIHVDLQNVFLGRKKLGTELLVVEVTSS